MALPGTVTVHSGQSARSVTVEPEGPRDLTEVLRRAGLPLNTRCGRRGLCEGCLVEFLAGNLIKSASGAVVSPKIVSSPLRACQHEVSADHRAEIRIPVRSLLGHEPQVITSFRYNVTRAHDPLWQRVTVTSAELDCEMPLAEAACRVLSRRLGETLPVRADGDWKLPDLSHGSELVLALEYRGDHWALRSCETAEASKVYGVAVDIGTTTVVVMLVDLESGEVVSTASALNAQVPLGDNVLTRINLCLNDKDQVQELQQTVLAKTLAPLIDDVLTEGGASAEQIVTVCVAGNTTMLHLLAGVDPSPMGSAPFTPDFLAHRVMRFDELPGASFATNAAVHLLPGAAAYVGADIMAGVFSSGMVYRSEPCLLVDVGTNGEIVLTHGGHLVGCATAAGPAFEGGGMAFGIRAGKGAISHVHLDTDPTHPQIEVIGGGKPIGVCGTGYVDFIAEARRQGLINQRGRITEGWSDSELICPHDHGRAFRIGSARGKQPIMITELDIASLLQAKAAIAAGIVCLLSRFNLTAANIETLYLAGGFGFHLDVDNLIGCGLLPGFRRSQVEVVGNTSLAGAYLALLDVGAIEEIKRMSALMEIVELNLEPDFTSRYVDQLLLP